MARCKERPWKLHDSHADYTSPLLFHLKLLQNGEFQRDGMLSGISLYKGKLI
jgi:hypothetical protein